MKRLALFLVLMIVLSSADSCSEQASEASTQAGQTTVGAVDHSKHEEFSLWLPDNPTDYYVGYSNNPAIKYLNQKFNVTLAIEQPPAGTETDSLSLMFGTAQYTDAVEMSRYPGSVQELYEDGIIIDIAEYLDYMPNFKKALETYPELRMYAYDDNGRILKVVTYNDKEDFTWYGYAYDRAMLEKAADGNVAFPSGSDEPVTIEDMEYMLALYKQYFEASSLVNYAPLVIPYNGLIANGGINSGFGFHSQMYAESGTVKHGFLEPGFFEYLLTMNKWFAAGYIDPDFASRVNDMFFMPALELTYSGAAGIYCTYHNVLGSVLSNPDAGLEVNMMPLRAPLAEGVDVSKLMTRATSRFDGSGYGFAITAQTDNIPRLLNILDYLYSEEGGKVATLGLSKEQIPAGDTVYSTNGLEDGAWWYDESGKTIMNPQFDLMGGTLDHGAFTAMRMNRFAIQSIIQENATPSSHLGSNTWSYYDSEAGRKNLPPLTYAMEDEAEIAGINTNINDYVNSMIPQFIMGAQELTQDSFNAFIDQTKALGLERVVELTQEAYERALQRG
jgi:hypothetical protein